MTAFNSSTLGLQPIERTRLENWVEFQAGDCKLALHAIPSEIADGIEISSPSRVREESPAKLIFDVADVGAERRRLESLGVPIVQRPWGSYNGIDPEGNVFGIHETGQ